MNVTYTDPDGNGTNSDDTDGKVKLTFAHAMAKVEFSARYNPSGDSYGVVIGEINLTGLIASNTLRFTSTGYVWDNPTTGNTGEYTLSIPDGHLLIDTPLLKGDETGDPTISTPAGALMLVPQTTPATAQLNVTLWVGMKQIKKGITLSPCTFEAGKNYTYALNISDDDEMSAVLNETKWEYNYTGSVRTFVAPKNGTYQLEVWGAQGGSNKGGKGGYSSGKIQLASGQQLYIYVGQQPSSKSGGWNGGGAGGTSVAAGSYPAGFGGGGATDISWNTHETNSVITNDQRIIVAGGGGGQTGWTLMSFDPGYGGGMEGGEGKSNAGLVINGGTQTTGYSLGLGQSALTGKPNASRGAEGDGGAGGGYYGGYSNRVTGENSNSSGAGGSGYVSSELTDALTIAGNTSFPSISGGEEIGHAGHGHARITCISLSPSP
jgi:hypothetical protein